MSTSVLVLGEAGTGKSASIRKLDPAETFIINVLGKALPFKGWKKKYIPWTKSNPTGNTFSSDFANHISATIKAVGETRPEIKTLIIDDFQYVMANEFMRKASIKGYEKFTEIGQNAWRIIKEACDQRHDLIVIFLSHTETDDVGTVKCKTIGKMLQDKITVEGMFTLVLRTVVNDGVYSFSTRNNGHDTVKTPMEMFDQLFIENDLQYVIEKIREYEIEEEEPTTTEEGKK